MRAGPSFRWCWPAAALVLAGQVSVWPGALADEGVYRGAPSGSGVVLEGTWIVAGINDRCTLSEDSLALDFDPDGEGYLPFTRVLLPDRGNDRFSLSFAVDGVERIIDNSAPPGPATHTGVLTEAWDGDEAAAICTLEEGPLEFIQRARLRMDGAVLRLEISLVNHGASPLEDVVYFRAANPDPDLDNYGLTETVDAVYTTLQGDVAMATGPHTGVTLGAGTLDTVADVGFCYRCEGPTTDPVDSEGRMEDWDLATVVQLPAIAPGYTLTFTFVYLLSPSPEGLVEAWNEVRDWDLDGWAGLDGDCDDADPGIYPGADEVCDGIDQDCDGTVDEDTECHDDDLDGFTEQEGDCDDTLWTIRPGAPEGQDTDGDGRPEGDGLDNDCDGLVDEGTDDFDEDGDGFSREQGDCNDGDPGVNPAASEVPYDGVDQDCDGTDLTDLDGDGDSAIQSGGGDCDDQDPTRASTLEEFANGIDDDCDTLIDEPFVFPGDVVLNELLPDPAAVPDRQGEFLELLNRSAGTVYLDGWVLASATGQRHVFDPTRGMTRVDPGEVLVLGPNPDPATNGGLSVDYVIEAFALDNTGDTLTLLVQSTAIDEMSYGPEVGLEVQSGGALQRDPACMPEEASRSTGAGTLPKHGARTIGAGGVTQLGAGAADSSCWCVAPARWGVDTDRGSPGEVNPPCPEDQDRDGWGSRDTGGLDCDDTDPAVYPGASEVANGRDDDCDGQVDEDLDSGTPVPVTPTPLDVNQEDLDGDGYTSSQGDCDDRYADVYPGAVDVCGDGVDQDCSGQADEGCDAGGCGGCSTGLGDLGPHSGRAGWLLLLGPPLLQVNRRRARAGSDGFLSPGTMPGDTMSRIGPCRGPRG